MTQEIFTFDDLGFGWSDNGNKSVTRRGLERPAGVKFNNDWYAFAGEITRLVREGEKAQAELATANRTILELRRINGEQCRQEQRLEVALRRAAPAGYKLVPHNLTPAMRWDMSTKCSTHMGKLDDMYEAALAAAPEPKP